MTKKRFLCFALAAMLICGSAVTSAPVYAGDGGGSGGANSTAITLTLDKEAPTGAITIDRNIWKEFLNAITFNMLFRTTKTVTITAEDNVAVASVKYYVSEGPLTLDEVKALAEDKWTGYTKEFQLGPPKSCVVYALITDTSGNQTYISSDGLVFARESSGSSSGASNVTNTTEDKGAGSAAGAGKVAKTTATVQGATTTKADGTKTTTATVDKTTAETIIEKAVANKSEEVVVNTGSAVTETAAGSTTEIKLPEQTVQGLSQKTEASVTIKSESAEVTLDKAAVDGLASQAGDDGYVKLVVETVKQDASAVQVDLKLVTSKGTVTDFKGGNVSVTVKLNASLAAKPVVCVYIDDFKTYHKVKGEKKAGSTYTFTTGHFSSYAVMAEDEAGKVIAEQTAKVEKLVSALGLKARSQKTAKGNIKVTLAVDAGDIRQIEGLGYTVKYKFYRSAKKSKGYQAKCEKTGKTYTNTSGKKGTKYYYKARVMVYDSQGTLIAKTELKQCKYACRTR